MDDGIPMMAMAAPGAAMGGAAVRRQSGVVSQELKPVTKTRKLFPETWIWTNKTVGYVLYEQVVFVFITRA